MAKKRKSFSRKSPTVSPSPVNARLQNKDSIANGTKKLSLWKTGKLYVLTIFSFLSVFVGLYGFGMPRISVQPLPLLDKADLYSTKFAIQNQSSLSLEEVKACLRFAPPRPWIKATGEDIYEACPNLEENSVDELPPMQTFSADFKHFKEPYLRENMDIGIVVYYQAKWWPFTQEDVFRFVLKVSREGEPQWIPMYMDRTVYKL